MKTFWYILSIACIVWYSTVTVYVGYKGIADIKGMLKRLAKENEENES
jgi:hypothetical protein